MSGRPRGCYNTKKKYVWVAYDDEEMPIVVCDTVSELAKSLGVSVNNIRTIIGRFERGVYKTCKYRRFARDD